jgi:hypothetical protein
MAHIIQKTADIDNIKKAFPDFLEKPVWVASNVNNGKIPINPKTGQPAKSNDPTTWGTLREVQQYIGSKTGLLPAIALSKERNLVAIDLDNCIDAEGKISHQALDIIKRSQSYTEKSVSGKGLHIFIQGKMPGRSRNSKDLEIYGDSKFITVTGDVLKNLPVEIMPGQEALDAIYHEHFPPEAESQGTTERSPPMSDEEILNLCRNAKNAEKFKALFDKGDTSGHGNDASAADMALCGMLAFYTQDEEQLERLLRQAKLKRPKWDGSRDGTTYLGYTIRNALKGLQASFQSKKEARVSWENPGRIADGEDLEVKFPLEELPDVLKEGIKEVSRAFQVDAALAALPAIGITALQIGKKALVMEKIGLLHHPSLFLCGVAESGERKSSCYNAILDPIKDEIELELEDYEKRKAAVRAHNEIIKEEVSNIKKAMRDDSINNTDAVHKIKELYAEEKRMPPEPFNFGDDLTPQRLFQKLYDHGGAYGVFSSDARAIFAKILAKNTQDGSTGEAMYLGGMWGDDIARSRVGNNKGETGGEDLAIRKPALTTVGFIQPDVWMEMARDKRMRQSGMISRIGLVIADSRMGTRIETAADEHLQMARILPFRDAVLRIRKWNPEKSVVVSLNKGAADRRREFHNTLEAELGAGGQYEDVKDIATKATSLTARMALIFALLEQAALGNLPHEIPPITEEQWLKAQALQEYFLAQAIDSQRTHSGLGKTHIVQKVALWLRKQVVERCKEEPILVLASQIAKGNRGTTTQIINQQILPVFIEQGWLRQAGTARGGKPQYEINPRI